MRSLSFKGETFAQQKADRSRTALQIPSRTQIMTQGSGIMRLVQNPSILKMEIKWHPVVRGLGSHTARQQRWGADVHTED